MSMDMQAHSSLKRPWRTPHATEHDDRLIRSGNTPGVEGSVIDPGNITENSTPSS